LRDDKAERARGLQIDDQFEFPRLLDREVGRLGTLEDLVDVSAARRKRATKFGPYETRPPSSGNSRNQYIVGRRLAADSATIRVLYPTLRGSSNVQCEEGLSAAARRSRERRFEIFGPAHLDRLKR
jgi:hypothetical protein